MLASAPFLHRPLARGSLCLRTDAFLGAKREKDWGGGVLSLGESYPLEIEGIENPWGGGTYFLASPESRLDRPADEITHRSR